MLPGHDGRRRGGGGFEADQFERENEAKLGQLHSRITNLKNVCNIPSPLHLRPLVPPVSATASCMNASRSSIITTHASRSPLLADHNRHRG